MKLILLVQDMDDSLLRIQENMEMKGEVHKMPILGRKDKRYNDAAKLLAGGHIEDAIELLEALLSDQPDNLNGMITLAVALLEVQEELDSKDPRTERAFDLLDRAALLSPRDTVPLFNKAVSLRKLGLLKEALTTFQKVLEIDDRNTLSILHMAEINYELENWQEAVDLARLALIRDPGVEEALSWVKDAMIKGGMIENDLNLAKDKLPPRESHELE